LLSLFRREKWLGKVKGIVDHILEKSSFLNEPPTDQLSFERDCVILCNISDDVADIVTSFKVLEAGDVVKTSKDFLLSTFNEIVEKISGGNFCLFLI